MKICAACGKPAKAMIGMGGVLICRDCDPDIKTEMEKLRAKGKPVNVGHIAKKIFRKTYDAGKYLLRDIPDDLWQKAKHRAVDDGDSLRDLVLKALITYLK